MINYTRNGEPIGRDRLKIELSPLCKFRKDSSGLFNYVQIKDKGFPLTHDHEFERFLISNGYEVPTEPEEYAFTGKASSPDIYAFERDVADILDDITDEFEMRSAIHLVSALYCDLYDTRTARSILSQKAKYLCKVLSDVYISEIDFHRMKPKILLDKIKDDIVSNNSIGWSVLLGELGYSNPIVTCSPDEEGFMKSVTDYINNEGYIVDCFYFGQRLLWSIDKHIHDIGWFPHESSTK